MDQVLLIKVLSALLYPLGIIFLLLILAFLLNIFSHKRLAIVCRVASVVMLLVLSNPMVARWSIESLEHQHPQQEIHSIAQHDAILVLGGGLRLPLPPARRTQIGSGSDRYWHAVQLYRAGKARIIVLAGGNVFDQSGIEGEAHYAGELLQQWGVPRSAIVVESASRTTEQNSNNVMEYLNSHGIQSVLLVTSAYHMPRALKLFRQYSIDITPASADILMRERFEPEILKWLPSAQAIYLNTIAAHEYYGRWFLQLKAFIASS